MEIEKLGKGQAEEEAKAQVDTLAEKLTEWQVNTFGDLLSVTLNRNTKLQAVHTLGKILGEVKTQSLVNILTH